MLSRIALRLQLQAQHSLHHTLTPPSYVTILGQRRAFASDQRPPRRAPPPLKFPKHGSRSGPQPQPSKSATGHVQQTSPGTSIPEDGKTIPKDSIGTVPSARTASSAATLTKGSSDAPSSPIEGARPNDTTPPPGSTIPLEGNKTAFEPLAQRDNLDQPPEGGQREAAQSKEAASENQIPPPEQPQEPPAPAHTGPLPDLRQGIPSTFGIEFGQAATKMEKETASIAKPSQQTHNEGVDIISTAEQPEGRGRGEREYSSADYETSFDRRRAQMANYLYLTIAVAGALIVVWLSRPVRATEKVPAGLEPEDANGWAPAKMWARVRARFRRQKDYYTEPTFTKLLPDVPENQRPQSGMTLVLSLEDLLIHSSWDREHGYRTAKRPGVDYFIRYLMPYFELVLFTSAPSMMADPVIRKLDPFRLIQWPLFREATKYDKGDYVKDLSYLNRDLTKTIIIDTSAKHVKNQPENAIILPKWSGDPKDPHTKDLVALIPFLENLAMSGTQDVRAVLKGFEGKDIAEEFAARESAARQRFNTQLASQRSKHSSFGLGSLAGGLGMGSSSSGLVDADGRPIESSSQALAKGKMWSDQIRERGQQQYEALEKRIREEGAQWLKEQEEEEKKFMEMQAKEMKKGAFSFFGGGEK